MREFPKTRPYVTGRKPRRLIAGKPSLTEILTLDDNGNRRSQSGGGGAWHGLYFWNGETWELDAVYASADQAKKAASRIRRLLQSN